MIRTARRLTTVVGGAALLLVALAASAAAHTEATATAADAGRTRIALTVAAECGDGALPTSGLRVQLPAGATGVEPVAAPGWTTSVTATEVSWASDSPAPGRATFDVALVLAQPEGETVYLPSIQQCPDGAEIAWIQVPQQPGEDLPNPAPSIVVPANATTPTTEAATAVSTTVEGPTTTATMALEQTPITIEGSETNTGGLIVLLVVVVVILGGALVLFLRYRTRGNNHPGARTAADATGTGDDEPTA